jgi:hypothetical protein
VSAETKVVYYILDESNLNIVCYVCEEHPPEEISKIIDKYITSLSKNSTEPKFRNIKISGAFCDLCKRK